jgi:hypothetical protein
MLWVIGALLFVLWLLGMFSGFTVGSWIHLLLALAIISVAVSLARQSRPRTLACRAFARLPRRWA